MAWTTPRTWVVGEVATAANFNTHLRDNMNSLRGSVVVAGDAFPSTPTNEDEFTLVDSSTAPTFAWRMKYLSGISGTYKWVCVGGVPLFGERATGNLAATSYSTVKTYASMPAGVYLAEIALDTSGAPEVWYASIGWGTTAVDADAARNATGGGAFRAYQKTMASAGSITLAVRKTDGTNEGVGGAAWRITPVLLTG